MNSSLHFKTCHFLTRCVVLFVLSKFPFNFFANSAWIIIKVATHIALKSAKKCNLGDIALFATKVKINVIWKLFQAERLWRDLRSEEKITNNVILCFEVSCNHSFPLFFISLIFPLLGHYATTKIKSIPRTLIVFWIH